MYRTSTLSTTRRALLAGLAAGAFAIVGCNDRDDVRYRSVYHDDYRDRDYDYEDDDRIVVRRSAAQRVQPGVRRVGVHRAGVVRSGHRSGIVRRRVVSPPPRAVVVRRPAPAYRPDRAGYRRPIFERGPSYQRGPAYQRGPVYQRGATRNLPGTRSRFRR